ncbi:MAG: hypothetical protein HQ446_09305 [Polaromonas sp.]|nr:hypothetical protein [Polaromonas sp.]
MKLNKIAFGVLALTSIGAFAAATPSCTTANAADALLMVKNCAPEVTFYAAGATAMKNAIQAVLTADGKIFNKSLPFATLAQTGNSNVYGYFGTGAAGTAWAGKKVAVIVNGTNGSLAGVNQLLTGLKSGSVEATVDQKEFITMQLHTATAEKAGTAMAADQITSATGTAIAATVTFVAGRTADFKTAWGKDKQKVAHMAFSDVRPSEATPGQVAAWAPAAFPSETIAMQGFGVVVNNNMYKALMARSVRDGNLPSACDSAVDANMLLAACQPSISTVDYTALMTGKTTDANGFLRTTGETKVLNLNRRPNSSGTQAATQIRFAGQANFFGAAKSLANVTNGILAKTVPVFDMAGADAATVTAGVVSTTVDAVNAGFNVKTNSGTGDLIKSVQADTAGLSIGVASLDNAAASKFGASNGAAASPDLETARWVKLDGVSPNFKGDGAVDAKQRVGLINGYDFAFEFQTIKSSKLAAPYSDIYTAIVNGLKDPAANLTGVAYINSSDATKNTKYTRGANNNFPLNKY